MAVIYRSTDGLYDETLWIELPCGKLLMFEAGGANGSYLTVRPKHANGSDVYDSIRPMRRYWYKEELAAARQRIAELEAQLNTRQQAVERDGDPLKKKNVKQALNGGAE